MKKIDRQRDPLSTFYTQVSPRGQITLPKPLRDLYGLSVDRLIIISACKGGIFLKPVTVQDKKEVNEEDLNRYEKDPDLVERENKDIDSFWRSLASR